MINHNKNKSIHMNNKKNNDSDINNANINNANYRIAIAKQNKNIVIQNPNFIPQTCCLKTQPNLIGKLKSKNVIEFINGSTNQAIQYYKKENPNYNIVVLNMANSHEPGGGYQRGACAQEEELCRTSPFLYASLANKNTKQNFYDGWADNWYDRVLYTNNTLFVRNDNFSGNYEMLDPSQYYECSVVTVAAPDMNRIYYDNIKKHENDMKITIKQMYYTPIIVCNNPEMFGYTKENIKKPDILILGAWGSGAFSAPNNAEEYSAIIAKYFYDVLKTIGGDYHKICFAIISDKKNNFNIFYHTFLNLLTKEKEDIFESFNIVSLNH
jgi:uncharacterized protein (TIGR02452 family)